MLSKSEHVMAEKFSIGKGLTLVASVIEGQYSEKHQDAEEAHQVYKRRPKTRVYKQNLKRKL